MGIDINGFQARSQLRKMEQRAGGEVADASGTLTFRGRPCGQSNPRVGVRVHLRIR
jgi:hypothetical protein